MQDQEIDIVQKWINTGYLRDIKPHLARHAAERLEAALRAPCAERTSALDRELRALDNEGYFITKSMNSNKRR